MPAGVSARGSLDKRRTTHELRDRNLRLAEPADEKVREDERLNMLRRGGLHMSESSRPDLRNHIAGLIE